MFYTVLKSQEQVTMGKYLAVFTALLFLMALMRCCFAAGGEIPSDDPTAAYLTVVIAK